MSCPGVCFIQSCHTSSSLHYSLIHVFHETAPSGTHSTAVIAAWVSADNRDNPSLSDSEQSHCGLWMLSVHPDVGNCLISPLRRTFFLLTPCDAGPYLPCSFCAQLNYAPERSSVSQVFGGGTPQRDSCQCATQSELRSCFGESLTDLTNCYRRIVFFPAD